ncbi:hypothetical protein KIPB_005650 [Kipferlia bialata]|uniref:Uncharacterized protein n=1 Tax=Kipferlia bialata TaxID=797122 RepID=A0A9K3CXG8_9EUKA|nr:hypothetical protein KIPB_005650 [Kipferlia bialata]|eukprot:g5650.t1
MSGRRERVVGEGTAALSATGREGSVSGPESGASVGDSVPDRTVKSTLPADLAEYDTLIAQTLADLQAFTDHPGPSPPDTDTDTMVHRVHLLTSVLGGLYRMPFLGVSYTGQHAPSSAIRALYLSAFPLDTSAPKDSLSTATTGIPPSSRFVPVRILCLLCVSDRVQTALLKMAPEVVAQLVGEVVGRREGGVVETETSARDTPRDTGAKGQEDETRERGAEEGADTDPLPTPTPPPRVSVSVMQDACLNMLHQLVTASTTAAGLLRQRPTFQSLLSVLTEPCFASPFQVPHVWLLYIDLLQTCFFSQHPSVIGSFLKWGLYTLHTPTRLAECMAMWGLFPSQGVFASLCSGPGAEMPLDQVVSLCLEGQETIKYDIPQVYQKALQVGRSLTQLALSMV